MAVVPAGANCTPVPILFVDQCRVVGPAATPLPLGMAAWGGGTQGSLTVLTPLPTGASVGCRGRGLPCLSVPTTSTAYPQSPSLGTESQALYQPTERQLS